MKLLVTTRIRCLSYTDVTRMNPKDLGSGRLVWLSQKDVLQGASTITDSIERLN